ncbi:putative outer membrane starch-binding protein [Mucilaginibacter gracilis]|uniref:Putative outer membrane starch-binding protein n=1 Tax=Mucilaginibacter gracilis TaxID=423350 RepID=A0A495IZM6_9SPHI|nr:RagB/SusD family nutrient uptake outer membrane protein [Mucilaginibacter gracilis]RKR81963.1 putative outer membrane starch-binding protein [Mucilaginibacter gracilis]
MKNYKIYLLAMVLTFSASCKKNFLDRTPGVDLDEAKTFADPVQTARFADNAYNSLINDYVRFNDHRGCTSQASDEAVSGNSESTVTTLTTGNYHAHALSAALNDITGVWSRMYTGIAITNKVLAHLPTVPLPAPGSSAAAVFNPIKIEGEMRFLRAFFYFELEKRFGGVPLMDKDYTVNDDINFPRASYDQIVSFILSDLAYASSALPNAADLTASNYGRATRGAALALKARVLLYAASPLNNPTNDVTKWKAAAEAAQTVIGLNQYSLQATYADLLNVPSSTEYIMIAIRGPRNISSLLNDFAMSPGSGGAQGQMDPTQNHVDMYEMKNGKAITDPASTYDPQNPYANRDPRFYANIIYNGLPWQGRTIEMWTQGTTHGRDYDPSSIIYTATRYYCKKYWPEVYNTVGGGTSLINYIHFRYGEVLLNYAEAVNEAYGPTVVPPALSDLSLVDQHLSATDAINLIRTRAGMPSVPGGQTTATMRDVIRHERAIELAFEDHRWYDIMRWRIGTQVIATPMYGMNVVKNTNGTFTYSKVLLGNQFQKTYLDYMHHYPIPKSEIYKSKGVLIQNPGWEN